MRTYSHTRYNTPLILFGLLVISLLMGGCGNLDLPIAGQEPLTDRAFFAQMTEHTGQAADWSEELYDVALAALGEMSASGSLEMERIEGLMEERGLVYETIAAAAVTTDVWPPRYDSAELRDALAKAFAEDNWLGALACVQTGGGGALLLVLPADMIDPAVGQLREVAKKIWLLTNAYRRENGLPPLEWDTTAARIAQAKTEEMYAHGYFEHVSPVTGDLAAQFLSFGDLTYGEDIRAMGENIAMIDGYNADYSQASYWMELWIDSPDHQANLVNENYTRMGVSVYQGEDGSSYAAQEFLTYMNEITK